MTGRRRRILRAGTAFAALLAVSAAAGAAEQRAWIGT